MISHGIKMVGMVRFKEKGYQSLLLVPTGILAQQHFNTLQNLVDRLPAKLQQDFGKIALLQGGLKPREKRDVLGAIQSGASRLVVSTHSALFTKDWSRLGFVVIDEQHKFGVRQKEAVLELCNSFHPHILSMSATPIPRTMALVKYGEMVVNALYESPPNRQKVETSVVEDNPGGRAEMQNAIQAELAAGGRAFIVYPLRSLLDAAEEKLLGPEVEVGEGDLRSATAEFQRLQKQKVFGTDKCVLLHGGMKHEDKAAAVEAFRSGQRPVMVCTSVVEVGVDVTQASIIVVEHADR
ncbi:P-loop containing nucleoside triphosphate hydrolase protein [Dunaliella salina]|uniref:P-loop containing nucleoside triphosphate hydrolase protein n=1 Tax=Dunaliella salina TaxID=3046 RepID=A0ABQ7G445_DUNSA|nr:P-loop containing nucleoside triphosphate hydrolase protein [Dunaliella salina]|eukprot:KAF5829385.1 P-loop containing nucleoside triphosphate hydrolase protein [Dunaliella salina]